MRNIHEQLMNNPKIPWYKKGINPNNKEQWLNAVHKKNPWLKESEPIFNSLQPEDQAHLDSIKEIDV